MSFFILPLESMRMRDEQALLIVAANPLSFALAATLGFAVNLLSFGVIQTTSSLTYKVLGQLKNVAVVCFSIVIFGSRVSGLQTLGYAISIGGFVLYNRAKQAQAALEAAQEAKGELGGEKEVALAGGGGATIVVVGAPSGTATREMSGMRSSSGSLLV